jgi:hypothetical protein
MLATCEGARKLAYFGRALYCIGVSFAVLLMGFAITFAVLESEPMFQRVFSVLILGLAPALLIWAGAFVICNLLKKASSLYDRTATALRRLSASLGIA